LLQALNNVRVRVANKLLTQEFLYFGTNLQIHAGHYLKTGTENHGSS
jgi:hypothetical protein